MKKHRCRQCTSGVVPGVTLTFDPGCKGCQEKKLAGKRTGLEPRPSKYGGMRKTIDNERFNAVRVRRNKAAIAKRAIQMTALESK
jgi:hypothetical protein